MPDFVRLREICVMIADDAEKDVFKYEHMPFDGSTMAAYQGEQNAMIQALANVLKELVEFVSIG